MLSLEQQIFEQINKANRILVTFNRGWRGDAVASALALKLWLEQLDKQVEIVAEKKPDSSIYSFLPGFALIKNSLDNLRRFIISLDISQTAVEQIEYHVENNHLDFLISPKNGFFTHEDISSRAGGFRYDLIITISAPDLESLGSIYDSDTEFFFEVPIINIDHQAANDNFGQINLVNVKAVSSSEILYGLFKQHKTTVFNDDLATCLLAGLISETRSFKTANVTPQAMQTAAELVGHEARREEIINALYRSRRMHVLKLWGRVLSKLEGSKDHRLVWSSVKAEDFLETQTDPKHLTDVIDELIVSMPQTQLICLCYEHPAGTTRALVHAVKNLDVLDLVKPYPSEGTKQNALVFFSGPLKQAKEDLIKLLEEKLNKINL